MESFYKERLNLFKTKKDWALFITLIASIAVCPLFLSDRVLTILTMIGISVISVHGLNLLTGYCGQVSLGHVGFMAVGGYISAVLTSKLGFPFIVALPLATLGAGLVGLIFGLPSLRIKGFYLIMSTVAAHFIVIWFVIQLHDITGGSDGLAVPKPRIGPLVFDTKGKYLYLVAFFAILSTIVAHNIARSRVGRAFIAIRDHEIAAEVMGINLWSYKLQAFFIGCVYAGLAGALLVHYYGFASVDQFPFIDSVWYLAMLIVGGMGSTFGAVLGAISLKLLDELVTIVGPFLAKMFPAVAAQFAASLSLIVRGLIIAVFLIFEPRGLLHTWGLVKSYFRLWPFSKEAAE
ncbi:MAG: branched-chain amino acid ABC transporter permease [Desulfobacterota bacterium]|nr:branched-chain amino acid ABC transporter permease [Thermodesulfobacteriota bacterium]